MKKDQRKSPFGIHPRNPHHGSYDFVRLVKFYPPLQPFLRRKDSRQYTIDFADPAAVLALNTALLKTYYQVEDWSIPDGYLCPPIPGRADYIHHAADLLALSFQGAIPKGEKVTCLDLGTGASIIYPILGIRAYGWSFLASDIDQQALDSAREIQANNSFLKERLILKKQDSPKQLFRGILSEKEYVDLSICNPPFYESARQAQRSNQRKRRNLKQGQECHPRNFGGQDHELWYPGGEKAFVSQMIRESKDFALNCFWFTSLVSREDHLPKLYKELEKVNPVVVKHIDMGQGNKRSRMLAWTFLSNKQQKAWADYRWS